AQVTPADGGLVAHLSGGLDSSGIAAIATGVRREAGAADPLTLSWSPGPEHGHTREHDRAESVADEYGLELLYAPITVKDRIEQFYRDRTRDPGGMVASEAAPMRIAAERGASVVLSGWGGDELASFSGRGLIVRELARTGRWAPLAAMVLRERHGWRTLASGLIHKPGHNFAESAKRTLEERRQHALTHGSWLGRDVLAGATLPDEPARPKQAHEYMAMLLNRGHLGIRGVEWGSEAAHHGIRYRYPLLDKRIVEFSLGVPTQMMLNRGGRRRWILASALEGIVPDAVRFGVKQEEALSEWRQRTRREAVERAGADLAERVAGGRQAQFFDIPRIQEQLRGSYDSESRGAVAAAAWIGVRR
ncbi:MAG: asparagine synthase, partial [Actinomycetia bacterium]|nr:asparagine synthase [Actinomycetes bacterium]